MDLKDRIREYLDRENLTQGDFAERAGVPQSTISQVLRGTDPRYSTVLKLENAMGEHGA